MTFSFLQMNFFKALIFHKNVAFFQRQAFNDQHKNKDELQNKILIEIDLKHKIVIGQSPSKNLN